MISLKKKPSQISETEVQLKVKEWLNGDYNAFLTLKPVFESVINQVVYNRRYQKRRDQLDDFKQECWLKLCSVIKSWDPYKGSIQVYLYRCFSNRVIKYIQTNLEPESSLMQSLKEDHGTSVDVEECRLDLPGELNIKLRSRFSSTSEIFIISYVCLAIYLRVYNSCGQQREVFKVLKDLSGLKSKRIKFLMDYSTVVLRRHFLPQMEGRCAEYLS